MCSYINRPWYEPVAVAAENKNVASHFFDFVHQWAFKTLVVSLFSIKTTATALVQVFQ